VAAAWRTKRLGALALVVWLALGVGAGCGDPVAFDEEELACEEAVGHLESCCDIEDTKVSCVSVPGYPDCSSDGCSMPNSDSPCTDWNGPIDPGKSPDISMGSSLCLRRKSCEELRNRGACEVARTQGTAWVECS
jgi:hypothetical protein